jgi:hypothetical protein
MTAVHPAARAGPSFRVIIAEGKFHGVKMDLDEYVGEEFNGYKLHGRTQPLSKRACQTSTPIHKELLIITNWLFNDDITDIAH